MPTGAVPPGAVQMAVQEGGQSKSLPTAKEAAPRPFLKEETAEERKVNVLLKLVERLPKEVSAETSGHAPTKPTALSEKDRQRASAPSNVKLAALLADACWEVNRLVRAAERFREQEDGQSSQQRGRHPGGGGGGGGGFRVTPELERAFARSVRWFEARGETIGEYNTHEVRLSVCRRSDSGDSGTSSGELGDHLRSTICIPITNEADFLRRSQDQIEHLARFKPAGDVSTVANLAALDSDDDDEENGRKVGVGGSGCWPNGSDAATKHHTADPTDLHEVPVYARENPQRLLGVVGVAVRYLPASPALYIFNEYDGDDDGTLTRAEFVAFVRDLRLAGGNVSTLENNIKYPDRYTCVGTVCGLTAPEDDMVTFVAQNHSLSMWAYAKNNDDSYSDDT